MVFYAILERKFRFIRKTQILKLYHIEICKLNPDESGIAYIIRLNERTLCV